MRTSNKCSQLFRCRWLANNCGCTASLDLGGRQGARGNPPRSPAWAELDSAGREPRSAEGGGGEGSFGSRALGSTGPSRPQRQKSSLRLSAQGPSSLPGGPFRLSREPAGPGRRQKAPDDLDPFASAPRGLSLSKGGSYSYINKMRFSVNLGGDGAGRRPEKASRNPEVWEMNPEHGEAARGIRCLSL